MWDREGEATWWPWSPCSQEGPGVSLAGMPGAARQETVAAVPAVRPRSRDSHPSGESRGLHPLPTRDPGDLGYSKGHLGLGELVAGTQFLPGGRGGRRPGQGPFQAGHIYITKGQNWRHWCNGLFIRTSLNRFWLSCLLPFPDLLSPPPCPEGPAPSCPAQPHGLPSQEFSQGRPFNTSPPKPWAAAARCGWAPSAPQNFGSCRKGVLRFWFLTPHPGRPGLPWNGARGGGGGLQQPGAHPCLPFPHPQGQGGSAGPSGM